jgi:hypothetical protein
MKSDAFRFSYVIRLQMGAESFQEGSADSMLSCLIAFRRACDLDAAQTAHIFGDTFI